MNPAQLTSEQKQRLTILLMNHGMPPSTIRRRLAMGRFSAWELRGLKQVMRDFSPSHRGSTLRFWNGLRVKEDFYEFMRSRGMSRATVIMKFREGGARKWELEGIDNLIKKICHDKNESEINAIQE